jgi:hopene-associated glycosyltransferase HpnB
MIALVAAALSLAIWLYLLLGRGFFWRTQIRDDDRAFPEPAHWPSIAAVIPARDEADVIGKNLESLLSQDYPGDFRIILVDDQSRDGTADVARATAANIGAVDRLTILSGRPLPAGWAGKVWAMKQGADHGNALPEAPVYILFTDADIAYEDGTLRRLAARAEEGTLVLTSLMVKLRCESFWERMLIPAFVFFFAMLYPFAWVNNPARKDAGAAGGCMLVRREALARAGGIEAIRDALIDDCALGARLKSVGPVWLGLTRHVHSLRPYPDLGEIRRMVARSAYHQLRYSPLLLAGTILGMGLVYVAPPALTLFGAGWAQILGFLAWAVMAAAYQPILRFYRLAPLWGPFLPVIAAFYMAFTLDSAYQHALGRGGLWKGRVQAKASATQ